MTIQDKTTKYRYEGNGTTDTFAFSSTIFSEDDLIVEIINRSDNELVETLVLNTHYTVSIQSSESASVTVVPTKIPSSSQDIQIRRQLGKTQNSSLPVGTKFPAKVVEQSLDRSVALLQELQETLDRSLKFPVTSKVTSGVLPEPSDNYVLSWDGNSGSLKNIALASSSLYSISEFWVDVLAKATVEESRDALGLGSSDSVIFDSAILGDAGFEGEGINVAGVTYDSTLKVSDIGDTNLAQTILHRHSTSIEPIILGARSNSADNTHADVVQGQSLVSLYGAGYVDSNYKLFGSMGFKTDDEGTLSSTSFPGKFDLNLAPDGGGAMRNVLSVHNDGSFDLFKPLEIRNGGTGAADAIDARANLGIDDAIALAKISDIQTVPTTSGLSKLIVGIPSGIKRLNIDLSGVSSDVSGGNLFLRLGGSSGIESSGYESSAIILFGGSAAFSYTSATEFYLVRYVNNAYFYSGRVTLEKISGDVWVISSNVGPNVAAGNSQIVHTITSGRKSLASELTQLQIFLDAQNFDAGSIEYSWEF